MWNKATIAALALAFVFVLAGCEERAPGTNPARDAVERSSYTSPASIGGTVGEVPIVTDLDTGCQYLGYVGHGITPRLDSQGVPICRDNRTSNRPSYTVSPTTVVNGVPL